MTGWLSPCVLALLAAGAAATTSVAQRSSVTFRASTGIVLVPVWVKEGEKLVQGLTSSDFTLTDNGVPQEVMSIGSASQPVDVTVVLDSSGSLEGESLARLKAGIQTIGQSLTPKDRIRLLTFTTTITEAFGFQNGGEPLHVERVASGGLTSVYDALVAALLSVPRSDRPQLVFGVTDGLDNASALKADDVVSVAGLSGAALYVTVVRTTITKGAGSRAALYVLERLRQASARSGGLVFENPQETTLPDLFAQVLSDFRTGYLLSFTPRGVEPGGWHQLVVRTKDSRYTIRSRAGYQGSNF